MSSDGSRLLTVDDGGAVTERDMRTGAATTLPAATGLQDGDAGTQAAAAVSPDLSALAVTGNGQVDVQQAGAGTGTGDFRAALGTDTTGSDLALSAGGQWLAFTDSSGAVHLARCAVSSGPVPQTRGPKTLRVSGAPASSDVVGSVYVWNVARHAVEGALAGTPAMTRTVAYDLAFSQDGRMLAASFGDDTVRLWSVATGARLAVLNSTEAAFTDPVAFGLGGSLPGTYNMSHGIAEWSLS